MKPKDVAASYDRLAPIWNDSSFNRRNGIAQHERALALLGRTGVALDVGCGSSGRFIDLLVAHGFDVEGLDLSAEMLRLARERHPAVRFHHADILDWQPERSYDFITAWDSIWHVPLAAQRDLLVRLCAMLAPDGVLIFTAGGLDAPGETNDPCSGEPMYHATLGIPELLRTILAAGCSLRHLQYDQWPESHVYLVVQHSSHHRHSI
jgi:SAM-dependent methyltransferase